MSTAKPSIVGLMRKYHRALDKNPTVADAVAEVLRELDPSWKDGLRIISIAWAISLWSDDDSGRGPRS